MCNDIEWEARGNKERCEYNSQTVANYAHKSNVSCLQCLWERRVTKQRRRQEVFSLQCQQWKHRVASPHCDFCVSAQWLRSRCRLMQRIVRRFWGSGETCSTWSFGKDGNSHRPLYCRNSYQCTAAVKLGARIRAKIRTLVRRPETIQTVLWCGFEACRKREMQHFCR